MSENKVVEHKKIIDRIKELNTEVQQRQNNLQRVTQQVENERLVIQQKLGAIQGLQEIIKEDKNEEKNNRPKDGKAGRDNADSTP